MTYELMIGNKNTSSWSLRPWLAMKQTGIAFREIPVKLRQPDTKAQILRYSPSGKVPALRVLGDDGALDVIWDSLAILEYLAERHPKAELWPADPGARALARSISAEMHSGFKPLRDHCAMDFVARLPQSQLPEDVGRDVWRIVEIWRDCRGKSRAEGPFLFGAFSAADAMYAPVASRFRTYIPDLSTYGDDGTAQRYVDTLFALPAMQAWNEASAKEVQAA
jgi:glutathione S-transferase